VKPYFEKILSGQASGFISEVNLAEFFYITAGRKGIQTADVWYRQIRQSRINVVAPDENITRGAALWKLRNRRLSLADCFALASWDDRAEVLLTTDSELMKLKGVEAVYISPFDREGTRGAA